MRYRKKPVIVEAFRLGSETFPEWFRDAVTMGNARTHLDKGWEKNAGEIKTLEGVMYADAGDFIIQGIKGEIYPCKPDIFEATYEAVA